MSAGTELDDGPQVKLYTARQVFSGLEIDELFVGCKESGKAANTALLNATHLASEKIVVS